MATKIQILQGLVEKLGTYINYTEGAKLSDQFIMTEHLDIGQLDNLVVNSINEKIDELSVDVDTLFYKTDEMISDLYVNNDLLEIDTGDEIITIPTMKAITDVLEGKEVEDEETEEEENVENG